MKFADNIIREHLDIVFVKRTAPEMAEREESNSNLWELEKSLYKNLNLYSVPVRDVKIGENIYNEKGVFITYRSN